MTRRFRPAQPVEPRKAAATPAYPADAPPDPSRRRFLRQLVAGTGAVGVAGRLGLAGAQSAPPADFSILEAHAPVDGDGALEVSPPARRRAARESEPEPAERRQEGRLDEARSEAVATAGEWVTENRALWVEPGYLVLLQWRRPADDEAAVAALEGASEAVGGYLRDAVTDAATQLHGTEMLGELETGIAAVLRPVVAPGVIDVLHLDHDCTSLCPPRPTHHPVVRGRIAPPGR
jgi:hypothetical protein